jgi:hypothetical protein
VCEALRRVGSDAVPNLVTISAGIQKLIRAAETHAHAHAHATWRPHGHSKGGWLQVRDGCERMCSQVSNVLKLHLSKPVNKLAV